MVSWLAISEYLFCITKTADMFHIIRFVILVTSVPGGTGTVYPFEQLSSSSIIRGYCVARSLFFCAMFYISLFFLFVFYFWPHCIVCTSSIYRFWLPLWIFKPFVLYFYPVTILMTLLLMVFSTGLCGHFIENRLIYEVTLSSSRLVYALILSSSLLI
jgi:hypothetical protein